MEAQQRDCLLVALCFYSALSKTRDLGQEKSFFTLLEFVFSSVFFCSFGSPEEFFFFCFFVLFFVLFFFVFFGVRTEIGELVEEEEGRERGRRRRG
jgi:hypothetical protein